MYKLAVHTPLVYYVSFFSIQQLLDLLYGTGVLQLGACNYKWQLSNHFVPKCQIFSPDFCRDRQFFSNGWSRRCWCRSARNKKPQIRRSNILSKKALHVERSDDGGVGNQSINCTTTMRLHQMQLLGDSIGPSCSLMSFYEHKIGKISFSFTHLH